MKKRDKLKRLGQGMFTTAYLAEDKETKEKKSAFGKAGRFSPTVKGVA